MWKLTFFGAPKLEHDGRSPHISRRKAKALLAYLAVTQRSHSREALADLFWPEYRQRDGRADLSRILSTLRKTMGDEPFLIDHESVALSEQADLWVDVVDFRRRLDACRDAASTVLDEDCSQQLAGAVELFQADFLAGFTLPDSPAFDEWQLLQSEALRRELGLALEKLVEAYEARNELAQAIVYAQRWVGIDPLHEPAQYRLIALYSRNGQRAEAHRQYQACKRLLAEELGVEPQPETKLLYEQIRKGGFASPFLPSEPGFVTTEPDSYSWSSSAGPRAAGQQAGVNIQHFDRPELRSAEGSLFVARTQELARLNRYLDQALAAHGGVVFITGGAGRGKSALLEAFARRAQAAHPELIVASGRGNAFAGVGDPYLPFRELLGQLAGNVAVKRTGSQSEVEQARRIAALLPQTAQAILEHGPQLLDVLVSGNQLLAQATAAAASASWLSALSAEVARRQVAPGTLAQTALFGQFTNVLHDLAHKRPLLLTLDDLQWMDEASIALLFYLGRHLSGSRLLIVGAYRPDELPRDQSGKPQPLVQVLDEFKRIYGDVGIDLAAADEAEGMAFIQAFLDAEPNQLDPAFRQALFQRTSGHPLFVVELWRDMQRRGDLVQDEAGRWRTGQALDWETFPARVEAVIARRVDRLDNVSRAILEAASVEGELFTAEVVAQVLRMEERPLLHTLSQQLGREQRLVRERGEIKREQGYLSSYEFSHFLFQQYLYRQLSLGERRRLHGAVAAALAAFYAENLDQVVVQLAHHATAAADWAQAVVYQSRAGDLAYERASLPDAARHYRSALEHWPLSDNRGQAELLRKLGECLWILGQHLEAVETLQSSYKLFHETGDNQGAATAQRLLGRAYWESGQLDEAGRCYRHALNILEGEPESEAQAWALASMSNYHMHLGNYEESISLGEQALALARRLGVNALIIQCLCDLGAAISSKGDWAGMALEEESLALALAANRPHDAGRAYQYVAECLLYLGRYEQARSLLEEAIVYTKRMHVPYITEGAAMRLSEVDQLTGRWSAILSQLQPMIARVGSEQPASLFHIYLCLSLGRFYNDLGLAEEAHKLLAEALATPVKSLDPRVALLGELARTEALRGQLDATVTATKALLQQTEQARYLFPNISMALLFVCRLPVAFGLPDMLRAAHSARQQLERLDHQYGTPVTAACLLEARGWLALAKEEATQAAVAFQGAVARWKTLGHPYDQARALDGLRRALDRVGNQDGARSAAERGKALIELLAAELEESALRSSFLDTSLARTAG